MKRNITALAFTLVVGIAIGAFAAGGDGLFEKESVADIRAATSPETHLMIDEETKAQALNDPAIMLRILDSLTAILDAEVSERRVLAEELDALRLQLADLEENLAERTMVAFAERNSDGRNVRVGRRMPTSDIEERLILAGFDPELARRVREREDQQQMDALYLRDKATREGWLNSRRYQEELQALQSSGSSIRQELGDPQYDRYLYASGRPNRVAINRVLETSPAKRAGLRQGDEIISYDGKRVFSIQDLIAYETTGSAGDTVTMEIVRDGRRVQIYVPRGPLGFTPNYMTVDPDNPSGNGS